MDIQKFKKLPLLGILRNIELSDIEPIMAVGGVNASNAGGYFAEGASAVAFGGSVFTKERLIKKEFQLITKDIQKLVKSVKAAIK